MAADIASPEGLAAPAPAAAADPAANVADQSEEAQRQPPLPPVQVCVRLRPLLEWETKEGHGCSSMQLKTGRNGTITLLPRNDSAAEGGKGEGGAKVDATTAARNAAPRNFGFSAVFGPESTQRGVWNDARLPELVDKVVDGFNATVLAYGQTGSGKTHTMEGFTYHDNNATAPGLKRPPRARAKDTPPEQLGLVPRAVNALFESIKRRQEALVQSGAQPAPQESYDVKVSFLQIYNERIFDLLNGAGVNAGGGGTFGSNLVEKKEKDEDKEGGLRLRWDANRELFYVENLFEYECGAAEDAVTHYTAGVRNKQVAATAMNAQSSRSHAVFYMTLTHRTALGEAGEDSKAPVREVVSSLVLVDLAGSERAAASTATGVQNGTERFKEAVNINQSLFALRRVVTALCQRRDGEEISGHVPYRDSKLTSLLQHTIGGNAFMLMFACLSPADRHYDENLSTLQYATQAACIKNVPVVNMDPKDKLIQKLKMQLAAAHDFILNKLGVDELPPELLHIASNGGSRTRVAKSASRHEPAEKISKQEQSEKASRHEQWEREREKERRHEQWEKAHQQHQQQQQQKQEQQPPHEQQQQPQHQPHQGQQRRLQRRRSSSAVRLVLQQHPLVMQQKPPIDERGADCRGPAPDGRDRSQLSSAETPSVEAKDTTPPGPRHRGGSGGRGANRTTGGAGGGALGFLARQAREFAGTGGSGGDSGSSAEASRDEDASSLGMHAAQACLWNEDGTPAAEGLARSRSMAHEDTSKRWVTPPRQRAVAPKCEDPGSSMYMGNTLKNHHHRPPSLPGAQQREMMGSTGSNRLPPIAPNSLGGRGVGTLPQKLASATPLAAYTQSQASFYGKVLKNQRRSRSSSSLPANRGSSPMRRGGRSASALPFGDSGTMEDSDLAIGVLDNSDAAELREANARLEDDLTSAQKRVQELESRLRSAALHAERMAQEQDLDDEDAHMLAIARKARAQYRRQPSSDEEENSSAGGSMSDRSDF